ncbi:response regulator [Desulfatitalea alkaliphila]|uniref:protein-glutamate methylesterase n=1 Tax=Desulfatitalea alkaliphila TaxID=2929485 RepID=A0AA41UNZ6_9BACT|nr:response regulator [Desulfatitalea alkaliphila]MCJ8499993.1 response regulator [Desulfatitalea alkaliphila]
MMNSVKRTVEEERSGGFAGTLRNIQLTDIIQMCCLAGASLCIRVRQEDEQGTIYVRDGELVHAEYGSVTGVDAFFTILGWQSGRFETLDAPWQSSATIKEPYQFLLMEAARRADEKAQVDRTVDAQAATADAKAPIRVLIVDDSAIMSKILGSMLEADAGIQVVGNAKNGEEALAMMKRLEPDLITMDVNMPVMDGSTALKHIMIESPCPVLIMSNLASSSYATILSFLNLGAVDFMSKPVKNRNILLQQQRIVERVHLAVDTRVDRFRRLRMPRLRPEEKIRVDDTVPGDTLLVTLSGVGGYLEMVNTLTSLPRQARAVVVSLQSVPPQFAPTLSEYLDARSPYDVKVLAAGSPLCAGRCYVGTTGQGWTVRDLGGRRMLQPLLGPRPEGDHDTTLDLFLSKAAEIYGRRTVVCLLSGGPPDALAGLRAVRDAGGRVLSPKVEKAILPATMAPAMAHDLITELFDPKDLAHVLSRHCT